MTGSRKTYWVLDPVDGTSNFAHGLPLCAVALGLVHHTQPVLGVIALPWLGRCYWATHDGGAYRDGAEIAAADTSALANALIAIGDYDTTPTARNDVLFALDRVGSTRARGLRRLGSAAVDLAWIADGSLDISITLGNRPWDTAAGALIAREAGAVVIDADGSQHSTQSRCVVAAAPGLEHEVLTLTSLIHDSPFWQDPTFPTALSTTKET